MKFSQKNNVHKKSHRLSCEAATHTFHVPAMEKSLIVLNEHKMN